MVHFRAVRLVLAGLGVALTAGTAGATGSSVTLAWNSSDTPAIAGYRVYVGGETQNYTNIVDVGNANSATITGLIPGTTYFFAATAYDSLGLESPFSSEIAYAVPLPRATLELSLLPFGQVLLGGTAPSGYYYEVQTSTDLVNWSTLGGVLADTAGFLTFIDPLGLGGGARWYRLRQTSP
jgi:hypothetical protein